MVAVHQHVIGFMVAVQSPKQSPAFVRGRVASWLAGFRLHLEELTPEKLANNIHALQNDGVPRAPREANFPVKPVNPRARQAPQQHPRPAGASRATADSSPDRQTMRGTHTEHCSCLDKTWISPLMHTAVAGTNRRREERICTPLT
eukprot:519500-Pyramimonas_sp.AAC.1